MTAWYLDNGLAVLRSQLEALHPGIVIGTIGDAAHSSEESDHNPDPDGSVDAVDPMIGPHYSTEQAQEEVDAIVSSRDNRIKYLIWHKRIISSTVNPWVWREYTGTSDPHTSHWHLSVNDSHHSNLSKWKLSMTLKNHTLLTLDDYSVAELRQGDSDSDFNGSYMVVRLQTLLTMKGHKLTADGDYGPATAAAVKAMFGGDGKTVTLPQWASLSGLVKK